MWKYFALFRALIVAGMFFPSGFYFKISNNWENLFLTKAKKNPI
jgi:hypothetical protein